MKWKVEAITFVQYNTERKCLHISAKTQTKHDTIIDDEAHHYSKQLSNQVSRAALTLPKHADPQSGLRH